MCIGREFRQAVQCHSVHTMVHEGMAHGRDGGCVQDAMKYELRVEYDKLPGVVDRTKGTYGCCAAALRTCGENGLYYLFHSIESYTM